MDIGDNSDNAHPGTVATNTQSMKQWFISRPESTSHRFIDDSHRFAIAAIGIGEKSAFEQLHSHCLDVTRRYQADIAVIFLAVRGHRPSFDYEFRRPSPIAIRNPRCISRID